MSKFELFLAAGLIASSGSLWALDMNSEAGRGRDSVGAPRSRPSKSGLDRNELRAAVDETQALLDSLARESSSLAKAEHDALYKSLHDEYHLDKYVGKGRKCLEQAEEVLEIQNAIKGQQALLKSLPVEGSEKEESKLLGLQSDLVGAVDALRDNLRDIHNNSNADEVRDFRNWIMVSEGLLRTRREDREAQAAALSGTAEALSAADISPSASALTATPSALSITPAPADKP